MIRRPLQHWIVGIIGVLIAILACKMLGFELRWPTPWTVIFFIPILAVVNIVIGTILRLVSAPVNCLTFGLFSFVINAIIFWIAGLITQAEMSWASPLIGSIVLTIIAGLLNGIIDRRRS